MLKTLPSKMPFNNCDSSIIISPTLLYLVLNIVYLLYLTMSSRLNVLFPSNVTNLSFYIKISIPITNVIYMLTICSFLEAIRTSFMN